MTEVTSSDAGTKLTLPSLNKAKKVMDEMKEIVFEEKTVNFLKGLPSMIMQNGLGQTFAFIKSKSKDKKNDYYKIMGIFNKLYNSKDLVKEILTYTPAKYINSQKDAIEYAGWMKKFALAYNTNPEKEAANATAAP